MRTLIVNRLYGNMRGIKLKKLSLYSFNLIAWSATDPSVGRIPGGNLPFGSQLSAKHVPCHAQIRVGMQVGTHLSKWPL
jgi:hypothetical protein